MTSHKIKLFAMILLPLALQSAAITNWNQQLLDAAESGNIDQVKEALKNGADVNFVDPDDHIKRMPLFWAASCGHTEIVNALILANATIDAKDIDQSTPLHYAAERRDTEVVKALILAKATIDARNNDQYTPLHLAAMYGRTEVVNLLLNSGADHTLIDEKKKTIFDLIKENDWLFQNKKDQITKIVEDYQKLLHAQIENYFFELRQQLNIPVPIANLITQYAFGICDDLNKEGNNHDKS